MSGIELVLLVGAVVVAAGGAVAGIAALVARARQRRNRVVPDVATAAPASWAGAHTPLARLHRRLRAAVEGVRGIPDPDGALISARVEVEQAALAVDDHLVALHRLSERERASRMAQATAAVASVEEAAARMADAASASRSTALPAVEQALERAQLVAEARRELDAEEPRAILGDTRDATASAPDAAAGSQGATAEDQDVAATSQDDEDPRPRPSTG